MRIVDEDTLAAVRAVQIRPRIVAVISGSGGIGATSTAVGLGFALARNRGDRTVLVDAHAGTLSLGTTLAHRLAPNVAEIARDPWGTVAQPTPDRLYVVDGLPWSGPLDARDMRDALGVLTADHAFVVLDIGNDHSAPAQAGLDSADQVVLVVHPGPGSRAAANAAMGRLAGGNHERWETVVVAAVCPGHREERRLARALPGGPAAPAVAVPFDRRLVGHTCVPAQRLRPRTARAYLALAARVAGGTRPTL